MSETEPKKPRKSRKYTHRLEALEGQKLAVDKPFDDAASARKWALDPANGCKGKYRIVAIVDQFTIASESVVKTKLER